MKMARVILVTVQMDAMSKFYGECWGLRQVTTEKEWREFAAGGVTRHLLPLRWQDADGNPIQLSNR